MSQTLEIFANNLKVLMQKESRNQSWLAEKAGLSPNTIFRILNMETEPTLETVGLIAKVFGVDPSYMLTAPDKAKALKKHEEKVNEYAEMRKLMKLQIENDIYKETLKKMQEDIVSIKNTVESEAEKATSLENQVAIKTQEIADQKLKLNRTEKLVRIFDGTPESLLKLKAVYGQNTPLSAVEVLEAQCLLELAEKIVGPLPELKSDLAKLESDLKPKKLVE